MRPRSKAFKTVILVAVHILLIAPESFAFVGGYGYGMSGAFGGLGGCPMRPAPGAYDRRDHIGELQARRRRISALHRKKKQELNRARAKYRRYEEAINRRVKSPYNRRLIDLLRGETECPYYEQDHSTYIRVKYVRRSAPSYSNQGAADNYSQPPPQQYQYVEPPEPSYQEPPSEPPPQYPPPQAPNYPPGGEYQEDYGGRIWNNHGALIKGTRNVRVPASVREPASDLPICSRDGRIAAVCDPPYAKENSEGYSGCRKAIRYYGSAWRRFLELEEMVDDLEERYEDYHDRIGLASTGDYDEPRYRSSSSGSGVVSALLQVGVGIYAMNQRNKYNRYIANQNARLGWPTPRGYGYPYGMAGRYGAIPGAMGMGGFGCASGLSMLPLMMMMGGMGGMGMPGMHPMGMGGLGMPGGLGGGMYMPGMHPFGMPGPWGIGGSPYGMIGMPGMPGMPVMGPYGFIGHGLGGGGLAGFGAPMPYGRGYPSLMGNYGRQPGGLAGYAGYGLGPGLGVGGLAGYGAPAPGYPGGVGGPNSLMQTAGLRYSMQAQQNQLDYARIRSMGALQTELSSLQYRMNNSFNPYPGLNSYGGNYGLSSGFGLGGSSGGFVPTMSPSLVPGPSPSPFQR